MGGLIKEIANNVRNLIEALESLRLSKGDIRDNYCRWVNLLSFYLIGEDS